MRLRTIRIGGPAPVQSIRAAYHLSVLIIGGCGGGEHTSAAVGGATSAIADGGAHASGGTYSFSGGASGTARTTAAGATANGGSRTTGGTSAASDSLVSTVAPTTAGGKSTAGGVAPTGGTVSGGAQSATTSARPTGGQTSAASTSSTSAGGGSSTSTSGGVGGTATAVTSSGGVATGGAATGGKATTSSAPATGASASTGGASNSATSGAPETRPLGFGQATTGCGSSDFVDVNSLAALQGLLDDYAGSGGLCIRYTGKFDYSSIGDPCTRHELPAQVLEIKRKGDITLMGADGSASDFGIHIASSSSNIIVRNMTFGLLPGGSGSDAISIEGMSDGVPTNIWIDHNELFSSMVECAGAGDTAFDGLIDAKKGADRITVSYNHIHDHHKVSLNGYSDSDDVTRHITFHHNLFENVGSRTPLQRYGYSHVLNNYFNRVSVSGINVRMNGYSLIESNYFENCKNPVTSRDSAELGFWELRNNNIRTPSDFSAFGITWVPSSDAPTRDATDWSTTASFPIALGYAYSADPPECLKAGLAAVAGAGKGLATLRCR